MLGFLEPEAALAPPLLPLLTQWAQPLKCQALCIHYLT